MSALRDPRTALGRWRASVSVSAFAPAAPAPRRRQLVFIDKPPAAPCSICGFALEVPGEGVRFYASLVHVACFDDGGAAVRGGV